MVGRVVGVVAVAVRVSVHIFSLCCFVELFC